MDATAELASEIRDLVGELRQHNVHVERLLAKLIDSQPAPETEPIVKPVSLDAITECVFCRRPRRQLKQLIAEAKTGVGICDECIASCAAVIRS